ncbi:MAG: hypothetical protein EZS28_053265, partial [Streblomastix strix]
QLRLAKKLDSWRKILNNNTSQRGCNIIDEIQYAKYDYLMEGADSNISMAENFKVNGKNILFSPQKKKIPFKVGVKLLVGAFFTSNTASLQNSVRSLSRRRSSLPSPAQSPKNQTVSSPMQLEVFSPLSSSQNMNQNNLSFKEDTTYASAIWIRTDLSDTLIKLELGMYINSLYRLHDLSLADIWDTLFFQQNINDPDQIQTSTPDSDSESESDNKSDASLNSSHSQLNDMDLNMINVDDSKVDDDDDCEQCDICEWREPNFEIFCH